jgi:hypothetical protein
MHLIGEVLTGSRGQLGAIVHETVLPIARRKRAKQRAGQRSGGRETAPGIDRAPLIAAARTSEVSNAEGHLVGSLMVDPLNEQQRQMIEMMEEQLKKLQTAAQDEYIVPQMTAMGFKIVEISVGILRSEWARVKSLD